MTARLTPRQVLALVALVSAVLALPGCRASSSAQTPERPAAANAAEPTRVVAAKPARKTLRLESVQPGQIEAFEHTPLFSKLAGYVREIHVDIGDRVQAQQLLVELSVPELLEELAQKEAAVAQAKAEVELAAASVRQPESALATAQANGAAAEAAVARAQADLQRWQSQYQRISELATQGALDRKLQEETYNTSQAAEAARAEAQAKLVSAKALVAETSASVAKAKAGQAVAQARYQSAQADLARQKALIQYTEIRAPYAGVVTQRNVQRGDFVHPPETPP